MGLSKKWAVRLLVNFVGDKGRIFNALFDYCFPPDYKLQLRRRLMRSYQGQSYFRDFARDVQTLAKRFPDVNKRQQVQIIWDGAAQYIRLEWMKACCSPESTSLKELIRRAIHFEADNSDLFIGVFPVQQTPVLMSYDITQNQRHVSPNERNKLSSFVRLRQY